jgi:hypothetical protein
MVQRYNRHRLNRVIEKKGKLKADGGPNHSR